MARFFLVTAGLCFRPTKLVPAKAGIFQLLWGPLCLAVARLCFATPFNSGNPDHKVDVFAVETRLIASLQFAGGDKRSVQAKREKSTALGSRARQESSNGKSKNPQGTRSTSGFQARQEVPRGKKQAHAVGPLERRAEYLLSLAKAPSARECQQLADELERSVTAAGDNSRARRGRVLLLAARLRERAARSGGSKLDWVLARETYAGVAADARLPETMREGARARVAEIARRHLGGSTETGVAARGEDPVPVPVLPNAARSTDPPVIAPAKPARKRHVAPRVACKGVWLDPGHGGVDSGAAWGKGGKALRESDLVLDLGRRVFKLLNKGKLRGKVWLTRERDETVSLGRRVRMVNKKGGCLFVSLHANSMPAGARGAKDARGIETYYLDPDKKGYQSRLARSENAAGNSDFDLSKYLLADLATRSNLQHSRRFGLLVQQKVMENVKKFTKREGKPKKGKKAKKPGFRDLGVKRELLYVLFVRMPAVLFEGPFLSNKADRALWRQPKARQAMAWGIAQAVRQTYSGL
ncbi:MAG: N-acetylmuramoyl-L-alanine amidase [Myxococcota bacterium]